MLNLKNVYKFYQNGNEKLEILKGVSFELGKGEIAAIMGPSGSGKSTLLAISAGIDRADSGEIFFDNLNLGTASEEELTSLRAQKIGFIFQNFQLIRGLSALDNVSLPLSFQKNLKQNEIKKRAEELLEKVGLKERMHHFPNQLSGGEEQRVAIARSFANNPRLLFADEPTGNLDKANGESIMQMLTDLNQKNGSTLMIVTHDPRVASMADRIFLMEEGRLVESKISKKPETKKKKAVLKKK